MNNNIIILSLLIIVGIGLSYFSTTKESYSNQNYTRAVRGKVSPPQIEFDTPLQVFPEVGSKFVTFYPLHRGWGPVSVPVSSRENCIDWLKFMNPSIEEGFQKYMNQICDVEFPEK